MTASRETTPDATFGDLVPVADDPDYCEECKGFRNLSNDLDPMACTCEADDDLRMQDSTSPDPAAVMGALVAAFPSAIMEPGQRMRAVAARIKTRRVEVTEDTGDTP